MKTGMTVKKKRSSKGQVALNLFFVLVSACFVYPLMLMIAISFEAVKNSDFSIIVQEFSLNAYKQVFENPHKIIAAYRTTIIYSVTATLGSLVVMSLFAYTLSKRDFKYRNILSFLLFFTTLFNGGLVPHYLVNSQLLHLNNTIWIYIFPSLLNAWNVIIIRTFFQGLPDGLYEAARIDGASELRICFRIAIPLAKPALASVGFLTMVTLWNNWSTCQIYIRDLDLYSLQYLLKVILDSQELLEEMLLKGLISSSEATKSLENLESLRFAMAVVAAGPMLVIFPVFQKYFSKGLTIGSVKG